MSKPPVGKDASADKVPVPRKASVPPVQERRTTANPMHRMDPAMLELLVCPQTRAPLEYDEAAGELISRKARLAYPVRDGIPILLVSEARTLEE